MRIGIVGMGWVGSSVAISTLHRGLASELLLNDIRGEIAVEPRLDETEHAALDRSAAVVRGALADSG